MSADRFGVEKAIKERHMRRVLDLARRAFGRTSPNPMVGAVIVRSGRVVGEGYHRRAGGPHAEVEALRKAGARARGGTLFVNLEPCSHFGRTPPCVDAVIAAGIRHVVVGMRDPNPLVNGEGMKRLRRAGIAVEMGILRRECESLNEAFIRFIRDRRPFVILKTAISLDGKIATAGGESRWISSEASRRLAHRWRSEADAIMAGTNTVLRDDPALTARLPGKTARNPARVILDRRHRIPLRAEVFSVRRNERIFYFCAQAPPQARARALAGRGIEIIRVAGTPGGLDLRQVMRKLAERDVVTVLLEGGGRLAEAALRAGIVDKVAWFIAPILIGGEKAPGAVGGVGVKRIKDAVRLNRMTCKRVGGDWLVEGYLSREI